MTRSDVDQVTALDRESFPTPWPEEAFLYDLQRERSAILWVAEINEPASGTILVATIVVWINDENAHIGTLAVKPGYRRKGIGQHLLANALLECARRNITQVTLEVRISNLEAQHLYKKFGFNRVGLRLDYYKDTHEDAVIMRLAPLDGEKLADLADYG